VAVFGVAIVPGGCCLGGSCPKWQLSQVAAVRAAVVRVAVVLRGYFPRWRSS